MNRQHFTDIEEAEAFVESLYKDDKWVIKASKGTDDQGGYNVEWQEHKKYTAHDGKEYPDEIWVTEQGEMILIQDLSEAHVRNVCRMMLRNERLQRQAYSALLEGLQSAMLGGDEGDEAPTDLIADLELAGDLAPADTEGSFTLPEDVFEVKGNTTLN